MRCWRNEIFRRSRRRLGAILVPIETRDEIDRFAVGAVDGPTARQIAEGHLTAKPLRGFDDIALSLTRARRYGFCEALAGIGDQVLDLRMHAGRHVGKALSVDAAAGGADPGKVVLGFADVATPSVPAPKLQKVGFDRHLKEGVIPTYPPSLAEVLVQRGDIAVARIEMRIALSQKGHEPCRRHALGNGVRIARADRWRRLHHRCRKRENGCGCDQP